MLSDLCNAACSVDLAFFRISYIPPTHSLHPFRDWIYPVTSEPFPLRSLLSMQANSRWHLQFIVTRSRHCPPYSVQLATSQRSLHVIMFVLRNLNCRPVVIAYHYLNLNQSWQLLLDFSLLSATCSFTKSFLSYQKSSLKKHHTTNISKYLGEKSAICLFSTVLTGSNNWVGKIY